MTEDQLFFLHAVALGMVFSFLYDCICLFRKVIRHGNFWISLEDLIFWVICSWQVFLFLHLEGNGVLRWFAVLGAGIGIWSYFRIKKLLTVPIKLVKMIGKGVIGFVRTICKRLFGFLGFCAKAQGDNREKEKKET